jgi:DNA-binding beta-propeller fold protein YncE
MTMKTWAILLAAFGVVTPTAWAAKPPARPTATPAGVVLVGAGDVASCEDLTGARATAKLLDTIPGTIFIPGDLAYREGSSSNFKECFEPAWGRHKARMKPVPGNHEYNTPGAAAYYDYFGAAAGEPGKGYYSYDAGGWHVVALNSNCKAIGGCGAGSPEEQWLRADLAAHPSQCTLAYWHHPVYSSGENPAHALHPELRPLWLALYEAGAELVVNGHEHNYERFAPQDPNGAADPSYGIREIVAGTGGKDFDPLPNVRPNSELRNASAFGLLKLTLRPTSYDWEFVPIEGGTFHDSGSATCHAAPPKAVVDAVIAKAAEGGFHLTKTIPVGGDGGWDYLTLDADHHRLYVTRGDHVGVMDTETDKVVGEIKDTSGVHGVALAPGLGRGFTSNGRANSVTIFDLDTLATLGEVKTGTKPDAILFDAPTGRVFTMNGGSDDATAIDAAKGEVVGTVALGGRPEFAVSDGKGVVFANLEDKAEIVAVDTRGLKVLSRWTLPACEEPTGLALDAVKRRLFAGCHNRVMDVMDADRGTLVSTVPIGGGVDATAFDPASGLAFSSNGEGTVTVVHEDAPGHFAVVENVPTERGARTMAFDPQARRLFLATAKLEKAKGESRPRPVPGSFVVLVVNR